MPEEQGPRRTRWLALVVSLALHSLLFFIVIRGPVPVNPDRPDQVVLVPLTGPEQQRVTPVPFYVPRIDRGPGEHPRPLPEISPRVLDTVLAQQPEPADVETADSVDIPRSPAGRLGPGLATGRLWVRPLPLPPKELAKRLQKSHKELVDSAISALAQSFMDSVAREPGASQVQLPDWTTTVNGAKFGLDSRNIYIAGLKIPAAVLALLPIPSGGNQSRALDHNGQQIAEDLRRAASRAQTIDEFKQAVRELRAQKQYQKDLERAQRELPSDTTRKAP